MVFQHENICRLCLKVVLNDLTEIDEVVRQVFNILSVRLDLNITRDTIICRDCLEVAKKCLKFKSTCFTTERIILLFSLGRENAKYDIKTIYKERADVEMVLDEDLDLCRICMTRCKRNNFGFLDAFNDETTRMLSEYLPEMDFNIIENPMICTACRENLEGYFKFVVNCFGMERKIKSYYRRKENASFDRVNLGLAKHFLFKDIWKNREPFPSMGTIKEESNIFVDTKWRYPEAHNEFIRYEELYIKEGGIDFEETYKVLPKTAFDNYACSSKDIGQEASQCNEINYKMYKCALCAYEGKDKNYLKKHMLMHKDVSQIKMHKCSLCPYEGKLKNNLTKHMLVHKEISEIETYKCAICAFQTKRKRNLKNHLLVHRDVSEIKLFKCSLCAYEAKQNRTLKNHMLVHKDVSEIEMHKCSLCAYEAKHRSNLTNHMLVHKDVSEIEMYKCSFCTFETKRKRSLTSHLFAHKDLSEIKTHKCSLCAYESKKKKLLKKHMLVHRDSSEIKMYKCSLCAYEAKQKYRLKNHVLVHKDISEINMHKCSLCPYEGKQKCGLRKHIRNIHKNIFELKVYKCSLCTYEAKEKRNLNSHMLVHKPA